MQHSHLFSKIYLTDVPEKSQIQSDRGIRDLMRLYAYNLTNHDIAVMMKFDTLFISE